MKTSLFSCVLVSILSFTLAQQQQQHVPQNVPLAPQGGSAPLLGVRYSAATDVSHISFNSPLVTYGSSLNEIQLPAAPIQPANLKQAPPQAESEGSEGTSQGPTQVRSFGHAQQQQSQAPADQPQYISVQQYPQLQSNPQGFALNQNVPQTQPQPQIRYAQPQPQQQYALPQPQQYVAQQPQTQQYFAQQPQQYVNQQPQQYVAQQQVQYPTAPASNGYFATGPFAGQYQQRQLAPQSVLPQVAPIQYSQSAPLISRASYNGALGGFSYSF